MTEPRDLESQIDALQAELREERKTSAKLQEQLEGMESERNYAQSSADDAKAELSNAAYKQLAAHARESDADLIRLRSDNARLQSDIDAANQLYVRARREVQGLRAAIAEHNQGCDESCQGQRKDGRCDAYTDRGMTCPDCPRDWQIELPDIAATEEEQSK